MNDLMNYYETHNESERLFSDKAHQLEWLTTTHFLKKYIPQNSEIFDCCAGTGHYAFWLAEQGYVVTAADLVQKHIDIMASSEKAKLLKDIFVCNAINMPNIKDDSYDVVLCMGAYYHTHSSAEREKIISECIRVLKPDGILVVAYINRNAVFLNHFKRDPDTALSDGVMNTGENGVFYASGFNELDCLCEKFKLTTIANIGTSGQIYMLMSEINELNTQQFNEFFNYHLRVCQEPSIIGNSMHGLYFAKK